MIYGDDPYVAGTLPYIDYVYEDKSRYPKASDNGYIDEDNDYLVGDSGGLLMKIDFMFINTKAFSEVAIYHNENHCYTNAKQGSLEYQQFWKRETQRRKHGMTANCKLYFKDVAEYFNPLTSEKRKKELLHPLRITGDHYNYLNYGRIYRLKTEREKKEDPDNKLPKKYGFPRFWDGDYWNFKLDEFIAKNGLHACKGKARRKGYSYKRGSQGANTINLYKNVTIVLAAFIIDYLTDPGATSDMLKTNLDWYEDNTFWRRGYLDSNLENIELGYKVQGQQGKKYGWKSKCISVSLFNNPSAAIGKDAIEIDFEEAGKCKNLEKALGVTLSSTEAGAVQSGTIRVYGTGGTEEADWEPFAKVFYGPRAFGMIALENIYDKNSRTNVCGFFHPQVLNYEPYVDEHGNSLLMKAYKHDAQRKEIAKSELTLSDFIIFVGQRANTPAEAFKVGTENIFSSIELTDHYNYLLSNATKIHCRDGIYANTEDGEVELITNDVLLAKKRNKEVHPYLETVPFDAKGDIYGCVREWYPPFKIAGEIPDDLYYLIIDPIGKDKSMKDISVKNSLYSAQVWMYPNNIANSSGDILVASFIGRRNTEEELNQISMMMAKRYKAKVLPEVDRGTVVADFKRAGLLSLIMRDPTAIINSPNKIVTNAPYGVNVGSGERADDLTIMYKDFLYTVVSRDENGVPKYLFQYILDLGHVKELLLFNKKGNFDRIACGRLAPLARKAYILLKKQPSDKRNPNTTVIGSIYS